MVVFCFFQDAKYPNYKSSEFKDIVHAVVESAPHDKQQS
jgi:hypothetical protein